MGCGVVWPFEAHIPVFEFAAKRDRLKRSYRWPLPFSVKGHGFLKGFLGLEVPISICHVVSNSVGPIAYERILPKTRILGDYLGDISKKYFFTISWPC